MKVPLPDVVVPPQENFCGTSIIVPDLEAVLHLREDGKKSWKQRLFQLRASGIYYVPKGKTKVSDPGLTSIGEEELWKCDRYPSFPISSSLFCEALTFHVPPPVVPRPRLLRPVGQFKRLLRQRLPQQIQGPDGLLLRPEGEFMSSPLLFHFKTLILNEH